MDVVGTSEVAEAVDVCLVDGCVVAGVTEFVDFVDTDADVLRLRDASHDLHVHDLVRENVVDGCLFLEECVGVEEFCEHDGTLAAAREATELAVEEFAVGEDEWFLVVVEVGDVLITDVFFCSETVAEFECEEVELVDCYLLFYRISCFFHVSPLSVMVRKACAGGRIVTGKQIGRAHV